MTRFLVYCMERSFNLVYTIAMPFSRHMDSRGRATVCPERIAERYPVVMHGVSLWIGSTDPLAHQFTVASLRCWVQHSGAARIFMDNGESGNYR